MTQEVIETGVLVNTAVQETQRLPDGRWQAGSSGNYAGRPQGGISLAAILREKMAEPHADAIRTLADGRRPSNAEVLVETVFTLAVAGDMRAMELCWDRLDGKVTIPVANVTPVTLLLDAADDVP